MTVVPRTPIMNLTGFVNAEQRSFYAQVNPLNYSLWVP